ncbi:MAG: Hint domain-containing protein [Acetobacteraceae bacterium]|nr:MAG: Hint domain-containing protein [Acetobacteraceae bacterium]
MLNFTQLSVECLKFLYVEIELRKSTRGGVMATRSYTLYTPILALGTGVGTLTVTDTNDNFFEIPDSVPGGQSALVNGVPRTIESVAAALGPQLVVALVGGVTVNLNLTPVRIVVDGGLFPDTVYIIYPGLPEGASVISVSLPLLFPNPVALPVCLTIDTTVMSDRGRIRMGDLSPGDLIHTRDDGLQAVRWIGTQRLEFSGQPLLQKFRPIIFEPDSIEPGVPDRRLTVSPQHAILLRGPQVELLFGEDQVLVAAKHLVNGTTIRVDADCDSVTYCHLLFDMHAIISADGADVESLYLGDVAVRSVGADARAEIQALYPELRDLADSDMVRARVLLKEYEARVLVNAIWGSGRTLRPEERPIREGLPRRVSRVA